MFHDPISHTIFVRCALTHCLDNSTRGTGSRGRRTRSNECPAMTTAETPEASWCRRDHSIVGQIQIVIASTLDLRNYPQLLLTFPPLLGFRMRAGTRGNLRGTLNMDWHTRETSRQAMSLQFPGSIKPSPTYRKHEETKAWRIKSLITRVPRTTRETHNPSLHRPCMAARGPLSHCRLVLALGDTCISFPFGASARGGIDIDTPPCISSVAPMAGQRSASSTCRRHVRARPKWILQQTLSGYGCKWRHIGPIDCNTRPTRFHLYVANTLVVAC
jgi:hypothetical protein